MESAKQVGIMTPMTRVALGFCKEITVFQYERALLYRDGRLERVLEPGRYRFWASERVEVAKVSLREMSHVVAGQGILTADQVEVRITLVAQYRVTDPSLALHAVENYIEQLHQELQLALRDVVAGRTIDQLLQARAEIGTELLRLSAEPAKRYGVELSRVGVRDVILPREVQRVLLLEVEADRTGRAELVKARHEVAAARARANTAKILAESPEVARLQELDALLALAGKGGNVVLLPSLAELFVPRRGREANP
jgi:regulator of protease activity HflC (stomatin/prohibitin superfamily)